MKQVTASMAGTVWNIAVSEGDQVTAGQSVVVLESMKMEIPIEAEAKRYGRRNKSSRWGFRK